MHRRRPTHPRRAAPATHCISAMAETAKDAGFVYCLQTSQLAKYICTVGVNPTGAPEFELTGNFLDDPIGSYGM